MSFVIVNVGTERAHSVKGNDAKVYPTERGAKIACTRLNKEYAYTTTDGDRVHLYSDQWQAVNREVYEEHQLMLARRAV